MILLKTEEQIKGIRQSCHLLCQLLDSLDGKIVAGMSTMDIDKMCYDFITKHGGKPAFLHYEGFPATACISVNEEIIHGIPKKNKIIKDGDLVSVDLGINLKGYFSDSARTFEVGNVAPELKRLNKVTRECLYKGIEVLNKPNCRIQDIGQAVFNHAHGNGFGVVREYTGHGVGLEVHESPEIPNYVSRFSPNPRIRQGMVLAIEPMINLGADGIIDMPDGWTVITADGKPSSHWEHTVAITANGPEILTQI
ncbi:MAG: type I methionyl aminopeptidase [Sphaerochaetaceae bacterium]|nr:type I methionyl aminopeptidase [Sphaerochaetaceae bacterium]